MIFDSTDIYVCFDNMKNKNYQLKIDFCGRETDECDYTNEKATKLIWDNDDQYFLIISDTKIHIFSLKEGSLGQEV